MSSHPGPPLQLTYRAYSPPASTIFLKRYDIPSRLFRADLDSKHMQSPGSFGFTAALTTIMLPRTINDLYDEVRNHIRREYGEDDSYDSPFISVWSKRRVVEDEIVYFRPRMKNQVISVERRDGPGDKWTERGRGKPWRVWAITGNKLKHVVRVKDVLGWEGEYRADIEGEEYLVWKHIGAEAVYAAEGGNYACIRTKRVEEIKEMEEEMRKKDLQVKAEAETEAKKKRDSADEESSDDDEDGGVLLFEANDGGAEQYQSTEGDVVARGRSQTWDTKGTARRKESRLDKSRGHARSKSLGDKASQSQVVTDR